MSKYERIKIQTGGTPILDWIGRQVGPSWPDIIGYVAGEPTGLAELEQEIRQVRHAIAKASDGRHCVPAALKRALADAEAAAERVGEPELREVYMRRARDLKKQMRDG